MAALTLSNLLNLSDPDLSPKMMIKSNDLIDYCTGKIKQQSPNPVANFFVSLALIKQKPTYYNLRAPLVSDLQQYLEQNELKFFHYNRWNVCYSDIFS
ncbi:MAG: hypothetical protein HY080_00100 [Gammaproteobacteria bacterium]|nr:hypothetical protein [Gammaproteobacteria bacterium]